MSVEFHVYMYILCIIIQLYANFQKNINEIVVTLSSQYTGGLIALSDTAKGPGLDG